MSEGLEVAERESWEAMGHWRLAVREPQTGTQQVSLPGDDLPELLQSARVFDCRVLGIWRIKPRAFRGEFA